MVDDVRVVITDLRAAALLERLDEALARHSPAGESAGEPTGGPYRSIGTPTMLPHSVQEPS
jgi:hypothetical protein